MQILIIEDEPKTARYLKKLIEAIDKAYKVIAICDSIESSVQFIFKNQKHIHLIFMDVHLADGSSFDIFNKITIETPVVFCTAYDEYALKAFAINGADYILKPFDKSIIQNTFLKLRSKLSLLSKKVNIGKERQDEYKRVFLVSSGNRDKVYTIADADIVYVELKNENMLVTTTGGIFYLFDWRIEKIESILDPLNFFRINRQVIVNRKYIKEIHRTANRQLQILMSVKTIPVLSISRSKVSLFTKWFY